MADDLLGFAISRWAETSLNQAVQALQWPDTNDVAGRLVLGDDGLARLEGIGLGLAALDGFLLQQPQTEQARQNERVAVLLLLTLDDVAQLIEDGTHLLAGHPRAVSQLLIDGCLSQRLAFHRLRVCSIIGQMYSTIAH